MESPTENWDAGGITKTSRIVTFRNGSIIREKKKTYGFAFTGIQTWRPNYYSVSSFFLNEGEEVGDDPDNPIYADATGIYYRLNRVGEWKYRGEVEKFWILVSTEEIEYFRDSHGYIIREEVKKSELRRWKQEGDGKETIDLWVKYANSGPIDRPRILADLVAYHWRKWTSFFLRSTTTITIDGGPNAGSFTYRTWKPNGIPHPSNWLEDTYKVDDISEYSSEEEVSFNPRGPVVHRTEGATYYTLSRYDKIYPHISPPIAGDVPTMSINTVVREQTGQSPPSGID